MKRNFKKLAIFMGVISVSAIIFGGKAYADDPEVYLTRHGNAITLNNGYVTVSFDEEGMISSLVRGENQLVDNLHGATGDPDKDHCGYVDYHTGSVKRLHVTSVEVLESTHRRAHIVYKDDGSFHDALTLEYHTIMERGQKGFYSYVIARNNRGEGHDVNVNELRTVYRFDRDLLDHAANTERTGIQPKYAYAESNTKVQDECWWLDQEQTFYTKYDYAGYFNEQTLWGHFGHNVGAWFIPVSKDYYPGGPLKQDLLVHQDAIILNYMTGSHFGTPTMVATNGWEKLYGPWMMYFNEGDDATLKEDALKVANVESAKWPYQWMNEDLYPKERTKVTGRIHATDGRTLKDAQIILSPSGVDPYMQTTGYNYYTKADASGHFSIPNVRAGKYSVYAYATHGVTTDSIEFQTGENGEAIDISNGQAEYHLGTLNWELTPQKNVIFHIGQTNRMSDEFHFSQDLRYYDWMNQVPTDLTYTFGASKEANDFYFAQTDLGKWDIKFDVSGTLNGKALLRVPLAAMSNGPQLNFYLNGEKIGKYVTAFNDQSIYRSANRSGKYNYLKFEFDANKLIDGTNTLTIENKCGRVMYDAIILETENNSSASIVNLHQLIANYKQQTEITHQQYNELDEILNAAGNATANNHKVSRLNEFINKVSSYTNLEPAIKNILTFDTNALINNIEK